MPVKPAAEREYKRTLELDPNDGMSRCGYGHILMILGRPDEALEQLNQALHNQPADNILALSVVILARHMKHQHADVIAAMARQYEKTGRPAVGEALKKRYAESGSQHAVHRLQSRLRSAARRAALPGAPAQDGPAAIADPGPRAVDR